MRLSAFAVLLFCAAGITQAQPQVVIYRCTDASGALTVQNDEACPKGSKQQRSIIDPPPPMPAYVPSTPPPAPVISVAPTPVAVPDDNAAEPRPESAPATAIAASERLPPPPIYQCNTWENDSYISEDPEPKPRCVRLQTTGLGGNPENGAGAACEMKYDQCQRVPDGKACDGWSKRQQEIESSWRFAKGEDKPALQEEFARVAKILNDTTCAN